MHPRHAPLYAHVHVLFWPWLWWQLWNLDRWKRATGRGVLLAVDRRGNVYIRYVTDAPGQGPQSFRAPVSARLALAIAPEVSHAPCPQPTLRRDQQSHRDCPAAGPSVSAGLGQTLPLPDT
ncbi:hypothetical protein [Hyphomonas sp. BRH_c22]|uniref:hypothetical protein n=1 Tax=Hyphomonas sp. BRH_c22 TaxID=1629710 RepID=UPI000AF511E3|nr:hypothetical protein [Hyphomonas sp. BRH_c22]